jgi:hypothetical protein
LNTTHQVVTVWPTGSSDIRNGKLTPVSLVPSVDAAPGTWEAVREQYKPDRKTVSDDCSSAQ